MNRLWVKLTLAFLLIAFVAVGVVALVTARTTGEEFQQYVVANGMAAQGGWADSLVAYYSSNGSWLGVESVLASLGPGNGAGPGGRGRGAGMGGMAGAGTAGMGGNLAIADTSGRVVASRTGEVVGERLPASVLAQGVPLTLNGQRIGTLINVRPADVVLDTSGQAFLSQVRTSIAWAGLLAVVLALFLGVVVSQRLTAPLTRLTAAALGVAGGDLGQRVPAARGLSATAGGDEIAQLGTTFNRMAASLAEAETLRRNLVADVAHELRTPLTVIQGNLQAILDGVYPLDTEQVASLYDETRLLTRLVDDLRDLALAEAGQLRIERLPVDVGNVAQAAAANFAAGAEAAGVTLSCECQDGVPSVAGDADRLAQVLRNLLGNALRHTPLGGTVTVRVHEAQGAVRLQVEDTGSGIAAEDLPHVFDRFYRADKSRSRRGGGAGLGLAIARQLVAAHGGEIKVESRVGEGTLFTVVLPAASAEAADEGRDRLGSTAA